MNHEPDDRQIREFFAQARRAVERRTPAFSRVWQRALDRQTNSRASNSRKLILVAAGVTLLAGGTFYFLNLWQSDSDYAKTVDRAFLKSVADQARSTEDLADRIARWVPPTDFLLAAPDLTVNWVEKWTFRTPDR
ncbi:MAG: hypothetical protein L0Z50_08250 [Verrucomicrobiales bacterium]|nr:hypothetical protein [Verrucomicrobiales bacterium]